MRSIDIRININRCIRKMEILFRRIDKCWQNAENHTETDVAFFLEENDLMAAVPSRIFFFYFSVYLAYFFSYADNPDISCPFDKRCRTGISSSIN